MHLPGVTRILRDCAACPGIRRCHRGPSRGGSRERGCLLRVSVFQRRLGGPSRGRTAECEPPRTGSAGRHVVDLLNSQPVCLPGPFLLGAACFATDKGRRELEYTAKAGRTYTPFTDDKCSKEWFRIADTGPWEEAEGFNKPIGIAAKVSTAVVAGVRPLRNDCSKPGRTAEPGD